MAIALARRMTSVPAACAAEIKKLVRVTKDFIHYSRGGRRNRVELAGAILASGIKLSSGTRDWLQFKKGELHNELGQQDAAMVAFRKARETPGKRSDELSTSNIVSILADLGRTAEALQELAILRKVSKNTNLIAMRTAEVWIRVGVFAPAARALEGAEEDPTKQAQTFLLHWLRLELLLETERFDAAVKLAGERIDSEQPTIWRNRFRLIRAVAAERLEQPSAVEELEALLADPAAAEPVRAKAAAVLANRHLRDNDLDAAKRLLDKAEGWPRALLRVAKARWAARALASGAGSRQAALDARAELATAWRKQLRSWRRIPLQEGGIAFLQHAGRRELLAAIFECTLALGDDDAATTCLEHWLEADAAASLARGLDLSPASVADVHRHLVPEGGTLLCYLPAPQGSFVLRVDAEGCDAHSLPSDRDLRVSVRKLRRLLRPGADGGSDAAAIRAIAEKLAWLMPFSADRVAIAGRELLAGMPFECLPARDHESRWLGLTTAISYLPNCALSCERAQTPTTPATHDVALHAVELDQTTAAARGLAAHTLTVGELASLIPQRHAFERVATDARWAGDADALFAPEDRAIVHALFAHGVYDGARATPSGLLLSDGKALHPQDVPTPAAAGTAPADFVLLAVCSAAGTSLRRGDDAAGHLGGALLQAGAQVVALADFDLEASRVIAITRSLLAAVAAGEAPDRALLTARRALDAAGRTSPGDWAQLRLEGLAARPLPVRVQRARDRSSWLWLGIAAAAATLAVQRLRRRRVEPA